MTISAVKLARDQRLRSRRQALRIDGKSRRTTYVYDDAGQETSRQYQDTTSVTQSYDDVGRRNGDVGLDRPDNEHVR
jgi:YD repeat-containing protein